jgi:hypothetical protein
MTIPAPFWLDFFDDFNYYTGPTLTPDMIGAAEKKLNYKFPDAYVQMLHVKNGGSPKLKCCPTGDPRWAMDHVEITGICGIGGAWGIDTDQRGSRFMIREWNYPDVGIFIAHCPSAGHDGVMLDYSECGPTGEPRVIHVDVEGDEPQIRVLAADFETFVRGLVDCGPFHERMDAS